MVTKFPIVHCFLRLFSQFDIKSLSIAVFSLRKCCETNVVKVQMLDSSIMIVKNTTLCLAHSSHILYIYFKIISLQQHYFSSRIYRIKYNLQFSNMLFSLLILFKHGNSGTAHFSQTTFFFNLGTMYLKYTFFIKLQHS